MSFYYALWNYINIWLFYKLFLHPYEEFYFTIYILIYIKTVGNKNVCTNDML